MNIYIVKNGQQTGPFTVEQIRAAIADGSVSPSNLAWYEGLSNWMPLSDIPGMRLEDPPPGPSMPLVPDGDTVNQSEANQPNGCNIASCIFSAISILLLIIPIVYALRALTVKVPLLYFFPSWCFLLLGLILGIAGSVIDSGRKTYKKSDYAKTIGGTIRKTFDHSLEFWGYGLASQILLIIIFGEFNGS